MDIEFISVNHLINMNFLKLKTHSIIDVITNSSTEIFISSNNKTIEVAKEFINSLLKATGSKKEADDLFDFITLPEFHHENYIATMAKEMYNEDRYYNLPEDKLDAIHKMYEMALRNDRLRPKNWDKLGSDYDHSPTEEHSDDKIPVLIPKTTDENSLYLLSWFTDMFDMEERVC